MKDRNLLGLATSDKEILEVTLGLRDKFFAGYNAGDFTGKIDPTQRPWYQQAASRDSVTFTETYLTGSLWAQPALTLLSTCSTSRLKQ